MPTQMDDEFGLGPVMYRLKRRVDHLGNRLGMNLKGESGKMLDPMTVNYAAWDEVRRCIRTWPKYKEAPNSIEIFVSPADWEDYWGCDTERKEAGVADYVIARLHEKSIWMAGMPQVKILDDEGIRVGCLEVTCRFDKPVEPDQSYGPAKPMAPNLGQHTMRFERQKAEEVEPTISKEPVEATKPKHARPEAAPQSVPLSKSGGVAQEEKRSQRTPEPVTRRQDSMPVPPWIAETADKPAQGDIFEEQAQHDCAYLIDENGFNLKVSPGDVIGAVAEDIEVDEDVNLRLDGGGFPYVEAKQCSFTVIDGHWNLVNYSQYGTKIVTAAGMRLMLGEPVPYPIEEGDTIYLGPSRPLTFTFRQRNGS